MVRHVEKGLGSHRWRWDMRVSAGIAEALLALDRGDQALAWIERAASTARSTGSRRHGMRTRRATRGYAQARKPGLSKTTPAWELRYVIQTSTSKSSGCGSMRRTTKRINERGPAAYGEFADSADTWR